MPSRISFIADKVLFTAANTAFISSTGTDLGVFNASGINAGSITAGTLQAALIASDTMTSLGQFTLAELNPDISSTTIYDSEVILTSPSVTSLASGYVLLASSSLLSWSIYNVDTSLRRFYLSITAQKSENGGAYANIASFYIDSQKLASGASGLRQDVSIPRLLFLDSTPVAGSTIYRIKLSVPYATSYHPRILYFQSSVLTISQTYY